MPKTVYTETTLYPVVIHREGDIWGYHSPEFGGGGAASHEDALADAQDLLTSAVAELAESGKDLPKPSEPEQIDADGGKVAWLPVVVSNVADRVAITLPKALIARIDAVTSNRSAFFTELARERLSR
ncbi:MAG: type II toxin-antitoxin system HicB family antitoxin [Pseudomonadota bacterium]